MGSSPPSPQFLKQQYYYFIIAGMVLIVLIVLILNVFAVSYCARIRRFISGQPPLPPPPPPPFAAVQTWIPEHKYRKEEADVECAVCLSAITDGEMVRELIQCGHTFHVACIDLWFRSHASCPICRSIVLPTPSESTEMQSQEAMLASRMDRMIISGFV